MKLLFLLYFSLTLPLVIFLTTILYGGVTISDMKLHLSNSSLYHDISNFIPVEEAENPQETQIMNIVKNRFTEEYLQSKTEKMIDDSSAWIGGGTTTSPVVSFIEVKEDILAQNPELLNQMQQLTEEAKAQEQINAEEGISPDPEMAKETAAFTETINKLTKSDFSFDLGKYLEGVRFLYNAVRIALPIISLLVLGSLLGIYLKANSMQSKLKWLGATLVTSSIIGFGVVFFNKFFIVIMSGLLHSNSENKIISIFSPIFSAIIDQIFLTYSHYQNMTAIILGVLGVIGIVSALFIRPHTTVSVEQKKNKKK